MVKKNYDRISFLYLCVLVFIALARLWPRGLWWVANAIQIAPLWVFLVLLAVLALPALFFKDKRVFLVHALSSIVIIFFIMGYNVPLNRPSMPLADEERRIRVASIDLGPHADFDQIQTYIHHIQPDVVAFQEAYFRYWPLIKTLFPAPEWHVAYEHELVFASRFPILRSGMIDRRTPQAWTVIAAQYVLDLGTGEDVYFYNLWLESPREGIEALMHKKLGGIPAMIETTQQQESESFRASKWAQGREPVLVAGDFNMLATSPLYQADWGHLSNAFSDVGYGFGYTKYTSWHGVRLDHVLYSPDDWIPLSATVGPDFGADHRPLIVDFIYRNQENQGTHAVTRIK